MNKAPLRICRRHDYVKAAMVEAAISIQRTHGTAMAAYLLHEEALPPDTIERILARVGPRRTRLYADTAPGEPRQPRPVPPRPGLGAP